MRMRHQFGASCLLLDIQVRNYFRAASTGVIPDECTVAGILR